MNDALSLALTLILSVESGGKNVIGDGGEAVGPYQIHAECLADIKRITGHEYTWQDCHSVKISKVMAAAYLKHYVNEKRLGRTVTTEDYCRCWNQGPSWFKKLQTTEGYWAKCETKMKEMEAV